MQVENDGWIRGRRCGKQTFANGVYRCALCDRLSDDKSDLCMPVARRQR